jgi:alpha-tubulin suppressor-like RCC1 family protein
MISASYKHSLILTENGEVLACGENSKGECGNGTLTESLVPLKIMDDNSNF